MTAILEWMDKAGRAAENAILVVILSGMMLLAVSQIVLRNFFDYGFFWGDELLRMLVLWIAVAGAVAASRTDKHINIAILDRFLNEKPRLIVKCAIDLFTCAICGIVAWYSLAFVMTSHEYQDRILGDVPAWIPQLILPIGFGLIAWRYGLFLIKHVVALVRGEQS